MFIDDTGCVKDEATNHPQRRYGGIVATIFDLDYLRSTFEPRFDALRERNFGFKADGSLPILHLRKMKNPKADGPFFALRNDDFRVAWNEQCLRMYQNAEYTVVSVSVDKVAFYAANPNWQGSVYELLVGNAIERYIYFLRSVDGTGDVMAEATNSPLDKHLRDLHLRFYANGTDHIRPALLQERLSSKEIKIKAKAQNVQGLQFADLLASTCFSHCKRLYANGPQYDPFAMQVADIVEREKFYRNPRNNDPHGYGRIWRP
jgi:hypothetical protein